MTDSGAQANLESVLKFLRRDARSGRLEAWGHSTVIDENTGKPSFDEALFDELHRAAGLDAKFPVGNAGVIHVYGYWFSEVMTPYGLKRDRWVDGELAAAFGLERDAFHLHDRDGATPLERVLQAALPVLLEPPAGAHTAEVMLGNRLSRAVCVSPAAGGPTALVYGIESAGKPRQMRLITVFSFAGDPTQALQDVERSPQFRWNAAEQG